MKRLRFFLMASIIPAGVLLGLTQLGGTPISSGQNTHFDQRIEYSPNARLALTTDAGDLTCWLRLRLPAKAQVLSANLSTPTPLSVYTEGVEGSDQWVAIVADGPKHEEKFKWPSGSSVLLYGADGNTTNITPTDWRVFLSDKDYDSRDRAKWRRISFWVSVGLLGLVVVGGGLQAYSIATAQSPSLTPQQCIEELIKSMEGSTANETKWMRSVLTRVLTQGVSLRTALAPLPLKDHEKLQFWFKTRKEFRERLEWLIKELDRYLHFVRPEA